MKKRILIYTLAIFGLLSLMTACKKKDEAPKDTSIGDDFGGGKVAYIFQSGDPGYVSGEVHGIIVAPTDQSTASIWGCEGTAINGADGTALGTGNQNTIDIVNGCSTVGIASRLCNDLELGGYSDWYLPSKEELFKLYLAKGTIGTFSNVWYWSSSEYDMNSSYAQHFDAGFQSNYYKEATPLPSVRAIRTF